MKKKIIKATKEENELYGPSFCRIIDVDEIVMIPKIPLEYYLKTFDDKKQLLLPLTLKSNPHLNWFEEIIKILILEEK